MGLVPHKAGKDASLRIRSGLSPATISSVAATSLRTPQAASRAGLACSHRASSSASSSVISVLSVWWRRGRAQRPLGWSLDDVGAGVGAHTGADVYDVAGG